MSTRPPALAWPRFTLFDAALVALTLLAAYALKRFYSQAGADELDWLLAPTTTLVEAASGRHFVREPGAGYVSRELGIVIAPACAGANYLIVALTTLVLGFVARVPSQLGKTVFVVASAIGAYLVTLLVNAARILFSLLLTRADALSGRFSFEEIHRLEGIVVYLGSLGLLVLAVDGLLSAGIRRSCAAFGVLFSIYVGVTVAVPWLNGSASHPGFARHASVVVLCALMVVGALAALASLRAIAAGRALERPARLG